MSAGSGEDVLVGDDLLVSTPASASTSQLSSADLVAAQYGAYNSLRDLQAAALSLDRLLYFAQQRLAAQPGLDETGPCAYAAAVVLQDQLDAAGGEADLVLGDHLAVIFDDGVRGAPLLCSAR